MNDLYYAMIDGPRYLFARFVWCLPVGPMLDYSRLRWLLPYLGDYAYWNDPYVAHERWTDRGYDVRFLVSEVS